MPEDMALLEHLSGPQFLRFVGRMYGLEDAVIDARREELFAKLDLAPLRKPSLSLLVCGGVAALAAWGVSAVWENRLGHATLAHKTGAVFVPMLAATLVYFAAAFALLPAPCKGDGRGVRVRTTFSKYSATARSFVNTIAS